MVKTKLRNTMLQERAESLLLLLVEQANLIYTQIEIAIDEFKTMNDCRVRRMLLEVYKLCVFKNKIASIIHDVNLKII